MEREISNVGVYVRKSREEETEDTLKRQEAVLIDLCKKNGWKYEIYREVGSSQDLDRPELQSMLEKIKSFHFDAIVIADLDRLSRNTGHFGTIKEVFINAGCLAITPSKVYDFTKQEDDLYSDIQSVLAKNEYQTIRKRLVRGTRQSAKDGHWLGKKNPIGYKYNRVEKCLELTEDASVVKRIFQEYMDGLSTTVIAEKFNLEGVTTSVGMIWSSSGISRLLSNPVYIGVSVYGKTTKKNGKRGIKTNKEEQIIVEGTHDAIIDKEIWDTVQHLKKERNSRPLVLKLAKHKFSGLIMCASCGNVHSFQTSHNGKKRINSCQTKHFIGNSFDKYKICENKGVEINKFEQIFFLLLSNQAVELRKYIDIIKKTEKTNQDNSGEKIKIFERQLKKLEQDIKRVQQGFKMQIYTAEEAQQEIKGYRVQKENVEKEMERITEEVNNSSTDYFERVWQKIVDIINGKDILPEPELNEKIREIIEAIIYKRVGDSNAEMELQIIPKFEVIDYSIN